MASFQAGALVAARFLHPFLSPHFSLISCKFTIDFLFADCQNEMGMMPDKPGNTSHGETHFPAVGQLSPGVVDMSR